MTAEPGPEPVDPVAHLLAMWSAATGFDQTPPASEALFRQDVRNLGACAGATLCALASSGSRLASGLDTKQREHMILGGTLQWHAQMHERPHRETLAALAFAADMLQAAINGVQGTRRADLGDAYDLAVKLRECLNIAAGQTDVVEGLQQLLAEAAGGEDSPTPP